MPDIFKPGDRVRLKSTTACPSRWLHDGLKLHPGMVGVVVGVWDVKEIPDVPDHLYAVRSAGGEHYWNTSFTADELEKA